ncbi:DUF5802 family protein [Natrarchaeobaculum sulfurireducens]|uniref:Uncharacterized protein n=1 Tax=Natrarchaeobaculum sulfurireducens TaxID=2044521 RepID=A0A346PPQ1_9EURY|nr:DUF5802 family protein [Natrarchaeobaculum sulfurireducens]AXR81496.1 hypothetical protein AArcMg_1483 [Natrarchaeobaculum sulfurireducens]
MILRNWNPAYKLTSVIVEEGDVPALNPGVHTEMNRVLYAEGEGVERLDYPILAKLKKRYFEVTRSEAVDPEFIQLPPGDIEAMGLDTPERCEMLVAKRENAPLIADIMQC